MGFAGTLLGIAGFGIGFPAGLLIGYFAFVFFESADVKDPTVLPIQQLDSNALQLLMNEIPHWVKEPDYERVDWLNKFLQLMWPYLDKAICKQIKITSKQIIDEYTKKFPMLSVEFEQFTLGTLPPTIHGIKVYDTNEKEIVIHPAAKWAGNPNIIVAVKASAFRATVQLIDLQAFVAPRITLKPLVPSFPCFESIVVSLMEKPHVDFGLRLLGADLMAIPGLYRFVQEKVKEQVAVLYLWPKTLMVPILDSSSGATKKPIGLLLVKVVRAANLRKADIFGKSDPYVKLSLSGERLSAKKTSVKMNNLSPVWNEQFKFIVKDPMTQDLLIDVFDWDQVGAHDRLGVQVVPLSALVPDEKRELTLPLLKNTDLNHSDNRKDRGEITLELTVSPFKGASSLHATSFEVGNEDSSISGPSNGGVLYITVHEADGLEGKYHTNPHVSLLFKGEEKKTKTIKKSRNPQWSENFEILLDEAPVDDQIHFEVFSKSKSFSLHPKESLGHVDVHLKDVVNNGRINEKHALINSKNGVLHLEIEWKD